MKHHSSNDLKKIIEKEFQILLNQNQYQDLKRLIFEIKRRENTSTGKMINYLKANPKLHKCAGKNKFTALKNSLIKYRFPLTSACKNTAKKKIFLNKLQNPLKNNWKVSKDFYPANLFFEKSVRKSFLIDNFKKKFPDLKINQIASLKSYIKNNRFKISELKKPLVFLVKETYDFLKPCPCTKDHLGCGYWILNLGFGCPFDCSYCYLQQYTNSPGIILPANLEDFFKQFESFEKKIKKPVRIGTGEFCDSLALDHITNYSSGLISYFRGKNFLLELKTKSNRIENILNEKPAPNIIISWSFNPSKIVDSQEEGSAGLKARISAAKKIQQAGFKIGLHFDPIIYYKNWESDYKKLIEKIFSELRPPLAWISMGTLRSNRGLKPIVEQRFPESNIFYGELFIGKDKKLRYPQFLRKIIYEKMAGWIKNFDRKTPIYLCMESKDIWKSIGNFQSQNDIEKHLIQNNL